MSYCVNCGVELNPGAEVCPLCQTPAWKPDEAAPSYFPTKPPEVLPVSKKEVAILLSSVEIAVALCCGLLNLFLLPARLWSLYVIGALGLFWVWFVLPMVVREIPKFFSIALDVGAVCLYVWFISVRFQGESWFWGLALPILGWAYLLVCLLTYLVRKRSILTTISMYIGTLALLIIGIEFVIDRFLTGTWVPGWSLIVWVVCVVLLIPLRVIRHVPSLREEVRRRFNF